MSRYMHDGGEKPHSRSSVHVFHDLHRRDSQWSRRADGKSIHISPELFEKIYLNPMSTGRGDWRSYVGNPTPIGLIGILMSLSPLTCDLLGWAGSGGSGAANQGAYYAFGGILAIVGGFLEWAIGNTFSAVVVTSIGAFFLSFGMTLTPWFNAYGAYSNSTNVTASAGLQNKTFAASFGFFFLWMAIMCLIYLVASLRTDVVHVIIFFTLVVAYGLIAGEEWSTASGHSETAHNLQLASGVFLLICDLAVWYLFIIEILASVDFPFTLPVGDLSKRIKPASEKPMMSGEYSV